MYNAVSGIKCIRNEKQLMIARLTLITYELSENWNSLTGSL